MNSKNESRGKIFDINSNHKDVVREREIFKKNDHVYVASTIHQEGLIPGSPMDIIFRDLSNTVRVLTHTAESQRLKIEKLEKDLKISEESRAQLRMTLKVLAEMLQKYSAIYGNMDLLPSITEHNIPFINKSEVFK